MPHRFLRRTVARRGWLAALAGFIGLGGAVGLTSAAVADPAYRPATAAPASWLVFAETARAALAERLAAADDAGEQLRRRVADDQAPRELIVRVWVTPGGTIERIAVEGVDATTAGLVRSLIETAPVGAAPPPDMAQPLLLKLTMAAKG